MTVVTWVTFGLIIYNAYPAFEGKEMRYGVWPMFFIYPLFWLAGLVEITKYFRHYNLNKIPTFKDNYVILFFTIWFVFLILWIGLF